MTVGLIGVVLSFAAADGASMELTLVLTEPATASLDWGGIVRTASTPLARHQFGGLAAPMETALAYELDVAGLSAFRATVRPLRPSGPLKIALYGDSRDGSAPHRRLLEAMVRAEPDVVVNTGDVVATALDDPGWSEHLLATLPLGAGAPLVLALGNHELYLPPDRAGALDPVEKVLAFLPAPADALAAAKGAPRGVFHVRIGPALFVSIDSNSPLGPGSAQRSFLEAALADRRDARFVFVVLHHGPLSAGPHGAHPESDGLPELFARHHVTAVLSGHDHTYQRIQRDGVSYVVSGGGGAPLYSRTRPVRGLVTFAAAYHFALITLDGDRATIEARSIEGALLDRAELGGRAPDGPDPRPRLAALAASLVLSLGGIAWVIRRLLWS
ncbi:MAG: metallophosphoesterase [Deltaproteobacteria bacterium]|nr:metallophosphoesterase [Deltaproteobacteria bacterium]